MSGRLEGITYLCRLLGHPLPDVFDGSCACQFFAPSATETPIAEPNISIYDHRFPREDCQRTVEHDHHLWWSNGAALLCARPGLSATEKPHAEPWKCPGCQASVGYLETKCPLCGASPEKAADKVEREMAEDDAFLEVHPITDDETWGEPIVPEKKPTITGPLNTGSEPEAASDESGELAEDERGPSLPAPSDYAEGHIDFLRDSLARCSADVARLKKELREEQAWHRKTATGFASCLKERHDALEEIKRLRSADGPSVPDFSRPCPHDVRQAVIAIAKRANRETLWDEDHRVLARKVLRWAEGTPDAGAER
jgi:hypothetical protein